MVLHFRWIQLYSLLALISLVSSLALSGAAPAFAQTPNPTPMPPPASIQLAQPLPQQAYLPLDLAMRAASAALTACADQGYKVSVTVVDQDGVDDIVAQKPRITGRGERL